ncbi:tyrosine-protein phosphatase [Candidatus Latescibacterota bacterium]
MILWLAGEPMIDLHTHLLPGLDDGSHSLSESMETLKMHHSQGCKTVICTPHISPAYPNSESSIKQKYDELKEAVSESSLDIIIHYGAEYHFEMLFERIMSNEPFIFLNNKDDSKRYLLVEFPFVFKMLWLDKLIDTLKGNDIVIVFAHPERYGNVEIFKDLFNKFDCLFAINCSSVLGNEGTSIKNNAFSFISSFGAKIVWCSDTHPALYRYPLFDRVIPYLQKRFSRVLIDYWLDTLPQKIIQGEKITESDNAIINMYIDNFFSPKKTIG